jgi:hypothetical protein
MGSIARQWAHPYDMNSTTIAPSASNTSGENVLLVTVCMRSLDPCFNLFCWVLSSVSFVIELPIAGT